MVEIKDGSPFSTELEVPILLNPLARATADSHGSYSFPKTLQSTVTPNGNATIAQKLITSITANVSSVGTDVELISSVPSDNETFLERNFTRAELDYCRSAPDFRASLAGRWSAKEATFKAMKTVSKGGGASMIEIEIVSSETGPQVVLHGEAKRVADAQGIKSFELSLSHSEDVVVAVVISKK